MNFPRRFPVAIRALCGALGGLGLVVSIFGVVADAGAGFVALDAVKYLATLFACYLFLYIALKGTVPTWLDV